jgi:hypothetical protein
MLHAKAMAVVVAYDIYLELAEGDVDPEWKLVDGKGKPNPVSFHTFRETLGRQMTTYKPSNCHYLGDNKFREYTKQIKKKRARSPVPVAAVGVDGTAITTTDAGVDAGSLENTSNAARLSCGFIGELTEHFTACAGMEEGKKLKCAFCGKPTYQFCGLCGVAVHKFAKDGVGDGTTSCFFLYHDTGCFGLARDDWKMTNKKRMKDWSFPTATDMKNNHTQMKQLSEHLARSTAPPTGTGNNGGSAVGTGNNGGSDVGTGNNGGSAVASTSDSDE